jgi:hypothetical protein
VAVSLDEYVPEGHLLRAVDRTPEEALNAKEAAFRYQLTYNEFVAKTLAVIIFRTSARVANSGPNRP